MQSHTHGLPLGKRLFSRNIDDEPRNSKTHGAVIYIRGAPEPGLRVCKENWMSGPGVKGSINLHTFMSFPQPCHNL